MNGLIVSLIVELLKWLFESTRPKSIDGAGPGALEDRLRAKIKKDGWE